MNLSDRIKAEVSLRQVAEAAGVTWDPKKSRQARGDFWAPCPLHGEKTSSFHVVEQGGRGGFFKCFGCGAGGTVIDFAMAIHGEDFTATVRRLAREAGVAGELSDTRRQDLAAKRKAAQEAAEASAARDAARNLTRARDLWRRAAPASAGGILAQYLTARGVDLAALGGVPKSLRGAKLDHFDGGYRPGAPDLTGPAMVAAIGRDRLLGVHRTWITPEGRAKLPSGKKASKQWLGKTGAMMGQPCVLSPPRASVVVGEGIETTLCAFAALTAGGHVGRRPGAGWCAEAGLSRGAITGPASDPAQLWTPRPGVQEVLILGEGSSKDPQTARELYEGARARLAALGLKTSLIVPLGRWDLDLDVADIVSAFTLGNL